MSLNADRFARANRASPIEYYSIDGRIISLRLVNGSRWKLHLSEFRALDTLRWAHERAEAFA